MSVLSEMAVNAVHPLLYMDVVEVNGLLEFVGISSSDYASFGVKQVALAIALEDLAQHPTMTMEVSELGILRHPVEVCGTGFGKEIEIGPESSHTCSLRIPVEFFSFFVL